MKVQDTVLALLYIFCYIASNIVFKMLKQVKFNVYIFFSYQRHSVSLKSRKHENIG